MDRLAAFNAFMHAAETGSFTAAARQIGVTGSAIGKSISRLEERLGVRLFQRSTRNLALTGEGQLLFERCRRIMQEMEAAEVELAHACASPRGRLRLSMTLVTPKLMQRIADFARAFPDIDLDIDCADRDVDLIDDGIDVALIAGEVADSRMMTRTLGSFDRVMVAAPDYVRRNGAPISGTDLLHHACLSQRVVGGRSLDRWFQPGSQSPPEPVPFATANFLPPLLGLAHTGLGIACVPDFLVAACLKQGTLIEILPEEAVARGTLRLVWGSNRQLSPKIKAFVEFLTRGRGAEQISVHAREAPPFDLRSRRIFDVRVSHAAP